MVIGTTEFLTRQGGYGCIGAFLLPGVEVLVYGPKEEHLYDNKSDIAREGINILCEHLKYIPTLHFDNPGGVVAYLNVIENWHGGYKACMEGSVQNEYVKLFEDAGWFITEQENQSKRPNFTRMYF